MNPFLVALSPCCWVQPMTLGTSSGPGTPASSPGSIHSLVLACPHSDGAPLLPSVMKLSTLTPELPPHAGPCPHSRLPGPPLGRIALWFCCCMCSGCFLEFFIIEGNRQCYHTENRKTSTFWCPEAGCASLCLSPQAGAHGGGWSVGRGLRETWELILLGVPRVAGLS